MSRTSTGWRYSIHIKKHITDDESHEGAIACARGVAGELRSYVQRHPEMDTTLISLLEEYAEEFEIAAEDIGLDTEDVNGILSELYDVGDQYRIWFGLTSDIA